MSLAPPQTHSARTVSLRVVPTHLIYSLVRDLILDGNVVASSTNMLRRESVWWLSVPKLSVSLVLRNVWFSSDGAWCLAFCDDWLKPVPPFSLCAKTGSKKKSYRHVTQDKGEYRRECFSSPGHCSGRPKLRGGRGSPRRTGSVVTSGTFTSLLALVLACTAVTRSAWRKRSSSSWSEQCAQSSRRRRIGPATRPFQRCRAYRITATLCCVGVPSGTSRAAFVVTSAGHLRRTAYKAAR